MHESVTGDDLYAQILMMRTSDGRSVLLVESPDDYAALSPHLDEQTVSTVPCYGGRNLDRAIELADAHATERVLAIRDRDFIGIVGATPSSPNVVLTDLYDLDATIFCRTAAGQQLTAVFGHERARSHSAAAGFGSPVEAVVEAAAEVGRLRLCSETNGWALSTREFPLSEVLQSQSGRVDRWQMLTIAVARSPDAKVDASVAERALPSLDGIQADQVACGHDLGRALSAIISTCWGGSRVSASVILQALRAALACAELHSLELYRRVTEWEKARGARIWSCRPT